MVGTGIKVDSEEMDKVAMEVVINLVDMAMADMDHQGVTVVVGMEEEHRVGMVEIQEMQDHHRHHHLGVRSSPSPVTSAVGVN